MTDQPPNSEPVCSCRQALISGRIVPIKFGFECPIHAPEVTARRPMQISPDTGELECDHERT